MNILNKIKKINHYCATQAVAAKMNTDRKFRKFVCSSLNRFHQADWGEMSIEDNKANNEALETGERILAYYENRDKKEIYIIADAADDKNCRNAITVLFPEEY